MSIAVFVFIFPQQATTTRWRSRIRTTLNQNGGGILASVPVCTNANNVQSLPHIVNIKNNIFDFSTTLFI